MWEGLIPIRLVSLKEETQRHLGRWKRMWRHMGDDSHVTRAVCLQAEVQARKESPLESSEGARPWCHLDFRLLTFGVVRGYTSIILNHLVWGVLLPQSWETNTNTGWGYGPLRETKGNKAMLHWYEDRLWRSKAPVGEMANIVHLVCSYLVVAAWSTGLRVGRRAWWERVWAVTISTVNVCRQGWRSPY